MNRWKKPVFGVGINDLDRFVSWTDETGKKVVCPIYRTWQNMLGRCYDAKFHARHPSYLGCSVREDWIHLSDFEIWIQTQDWQGKQLDKDILYPGNKLYSADTCVFIDQQVNLFIVDSSATRGQWPIGVCWSKRDGKFKASIRNPFTLGQEGLGHYDDPNDAHLAWRKRKHEFACMLADIQTDPRVAKALRNRYL